MPAVRATAQAAQAPSTSIARSSLLPCLFVMVPSFTERRAVLCRSSTSGEQPTMLPLQSLRSLSKPFGHGISST
eukprot:11194289-Lingulodinium_polyedra.AAC.1